MEMQRLNSSNIESAGWENGTLQVRFKGGGTYLYSDVPERVWFAFRQSESAGTFLATQIKGKFKHSKLGAA